MVDAELEFCSALRGWDPWAEPTQELLNAMQKAMAFNGSMPTNTSCVARQAAVRQLALEKTAMRFIPDTLQYRRTARWYLKKNCSILPVAGHRKPLVLEDLHSTLFIDEGKVAEALKFDCSRHSKEHTCMAPFREAHNAIRNWRVLWRSMPASMRREALLTMYAVKLAEHVDAGRNRGVLRRSPICLGSVDGA